MSADIDLLIALLCFNVIEVTLLAVLGIWLYRRAAHREVEQTNLLLLIEETARTSRHAIKNLTATLRLLGHLPSEEPQ